MEAVNPFIVGTPIVDEQNFYGRKALLRHILKEFSNPAKNSFLLYGPRLIGKTSLLKQLEFLLSDEGYTQIYIDLSGKSKLSLNELLYEISCVVAEACAFEPPRLENFDRHGRYFTEFFIPAIEKTDRFGPVALLFDVFDVPAQAGGKQNAAEFLPILARHFKALRQTKIVCSVGSHSRYMALAQHFDCVLPVSRFSKAELNAMMQTGSGQTVEWSEAALERLWSFTKGHPYLAQMFGNIVWSEFTHAGGASRRVEKEDVEHACTIALPYLRQLFQTTWDDLSRDEQALFTLLLKSGDGPFSVKKILDKLGSNGRLQEINSILGRLRMLDLFEHVGKDEDKIDFSVSLFKEWAAGGANAGKTAEKPKQPAPAPQPVVAPAQVKTTLDAAETLAKQDRWAEAVQLYEQLVADHPQDTEMRARLRHARNQNHLASRYNKALNAISCGDYENAQQLLAEVILREPSYKEASRFLLLATTGIDAKDIKQKLDQDKRELEQAKSQIVRLQNEIARAKESGRAAQASREQLEKLQHKVNIAEQKERESRSKLAAAQAKTHHQQAQQKPDTTAPQPADPSSTSPVQRPAATHKKPPQNGQQKRAPAPDAAPAAKAHRETEQKNKNLQQALNVLDSILLDSEQPEAKVKPVAGNNSANRPSPASEKKAAPSQKAKPVPPSQPARKKKPVATAKAPPVAAGTKPPAKPAAAGDSAAKQYKTPHSRSANVGTDQKRRPQPPASRQQARAEKESTPAKPSPPASFTDTAIIDAGKIEKVEQSNPWVPVDAASTARNQSPPPAAKAPAKPTAPAGKQPDSPERRKPPSRKVDSQQTTRHKPQTEQNYEASDFRESILFKREQLKRQKRKKIQAGWVAGTLNFLPIFLWVIWLWYVQPLEWGNGGKIFVLISSVPAWLAACRFGASDKEKHIKSFMGLVPIVSFGLYAILTAETLQPGIPPLTAGHDGLALFAGLVYFLIIALISVNSGKVASIISIGGVGGACAGSALFLLGGGSIEATIILALISSIMLIINRVDAGSAIGAGLASAIPAGFLLFAVSNRTIASSGDAVLRAAAFSIVLYFLAAGLAYALFALISRAVARPGA